MKKAEKAYLAPLAQADSVTALIRSDGAKAFCVAVTIWDAFGSIPHMKVNWILCYM